MEKVFKFMMLSIALCSGMQAKAQDDGYDVFVPIAKYISQGDAAKLSAWFADNLEISIVSGTNDSSKKQARQILSSSFESHTPRSFTISHRASRANMKYVLGTLNAGGESYLVTIFMNYKDNGYQIQQFKIERTSSVY